MPWKTVLCALTNQIWREVLSCQFYSSTCSDSSSYDNVEHVFLLMYVQCRKEWSSVDVEVILNVFVT